jgi:hypothetical protein
MKEQGVARKRAIIIYWTAGGNTEKVAQAIMRGLQSAGLQPEIKKIADASGLELYDYDLVCLGSPSYSWLPPEPAMRWLKEQQAKHSQRGDIKPRAPKLPGKSALVFVTYAGPHTGVDEGIPAGEYLGQFLAHIGYNVLDKWYVVGEFHNREDLSTLGLMGDIRGRPNTEDLAKVERDAAAIARRL